jgi:hypothetical protein
LQQQKNKLITDERGNAQVDTKKASEAQKRAIAKYDAKNTRQIHLKLNINTDADILDRFSNTENVQGYIKALIRRDMVMQPQVYLPTRYSDEIFGCPLCKHEVKPEADSCEYCGVKLDWSK